MRLFDSKDQLEELQYDVDNAVPDISEWRAHILRKAHQDTVKTAVVEKPANNQVLIIMDWAMKFLPVGYRETEGEWFGKKGKSWHVSVAVKKGADGQVEVEFGNSKTHPSNPGWFVYITLDEKNVS